MRKLTEKEIIEILDKDEIFRAISKVVDQLSLECYLVGGYVRDLILGRETNDIDVVVVGSGITAAKALSKTMPHSHLSVFKRYGTAQVKWKNYEVEFVGARKESYTEDSRNPFVEVGTLQDDQNRRDFTINTLAICLNSQRFGELVDPFGGLQDLEDGIICTPLDPTITFSDDPLRIMRCVRFATQLNFRIEDETFEALASNKHRLKIVSGERIQTELEKIINSPVPSIGFVEMQRAGILDVILPELSVLDIVETRGKISHKNNFYHSLEVLDNVARVSKNTYLRWAALFHDIGKSRTKRWEEGIGWTFHNHNYVGEKMLSPIFKRLKFPLDERLKYVKKLVLMHMRPIVIANEQVTDSAIRRLLFEAGDDIDDLMTLCEADVTSKNSVRKQRFLNNFKLVREKLVYIEEKDKVRNFQPPVDGNEIMHLFGLGPCREIGSLKSSLKDAILDGIIPNEREAALKYILDKAQKMGLTLQK